MCLLMCFVDGCFFIKIKLFKYLIILITPKYLAIGNFRKQPTVSHFALGMRRIGCGDFTMAYIPICRSLHYGRITSTYASHYFMAHL